MSDVEARAIDPVGTCMRDEVFRNRTADLPETRFDLAWACPHPGGGLVSLNHDDWQPGDVLLGAHTSQIKMPGNVIRRFQERLDAREDVHRSHHVGIHTGGGFVFDAVPGRNVISWTITEWTRAYPVIHRLRPAGGPYDKQDLDAALADNMCSPYDIRDMLGLLVARLGATTRAAQVRPDRYDGEKTICSVFVERVMRQLMKDRFRQLTSTDELPTNEDPEIFPDVPVALPMDFARSPLFESRPTFWCRALRP